MQTPIKTINIFINSYTQYPYINQVQRTLTVLYQRPLYKSSILGLWLYPYLNVTCTVRQKPCLEDPSEI